MATSTRAEGRIQPSCPQPTRIPPASPAPRPPGTGTFSRQRGPPKSVRWVGKQLFKANTLEVALSKASCKHFTWRGSTRRGISSPPTPPPQLPLQSRNGGAQHPPPTTTLHGASLSGGDTLGMRGLQRHPEPLPACSWGGWCWGVAGLSLPHCLSRGDGKGRMGPGGPLWVSGLSSCRVC